MCAEIKGLLFDYGGTLDTNGKHWAWVLWDCYTAHGIQLERDLFYAAYVFAEREMGRNRLVMADFDFEDVLRVKLSLQFQQLHSTGISLDKSLIPLMASACNAIAQQHIEQAKPILERLHGKFPMVMVSNFYGNLNTVLNDYGIHHYFDEIVESAVVAVRKPDPMIYALGVKALGLPAKNCLVIGDSYQKDMQAGKLAGCQTLWLHGQEWETDQDANDTTAADQVISTINELAGILL